MTAGEESNQACNHMQEQELNLKIVHIIIYP